MERLLGPAVAPQVVRVEQIASPFGKGEASLVASKVDGLDKAFIAEVAKGFVLGLEVLFGHHSERANGRQRATVLAIQFVDTVAIDNELSFLAARQIQVVHQRVARIVIVSVPLAVNAGPAVAAIPVVVLARNRSIERRTSALLCAQLAPVGLSVKTPGSICEGLFSEAPGRVAAAISAWSEEPCSRP
jgi:hypothetical protein